MKSYLNKSYKTKQKLENEYIYTWPRINSRRKKHSDIKLLCTKNQENMLLDHFIQRGRESQSLGKK